MTPPSNKQSRKAAESTARERAAALKAQAAREERRRKLMARGAVALVVLAVIGGIIGIGLANSGGDSKTKLSGNLPSIAASDPKADAAKSPPPWPLPTDTEARVNLAGMSVLPTEMLDRHDHVHLDIWTDGKKDTVPMYLGIVGGANATGLAALHTHDDTGVIHIEAPKGERHTLGQVFIEWNVYLSADQIGSLKAGNGKTLNVYVNGKKVTTDPSQIELLAHQEIAIVYGTADENKKITVPSTYKWTNGL